MGALGSKVEAVGEHDAETSRHSMRDKWRFGTFNFAVWIAIFGFGQQDTIYTMGYKADAGVIAMISLCQVFVGMFSNVVIGQMQARSPCLASSLPTRPSSVPLGSAYAAAARGTSL